MMIILVVNGHVLVFMHFIISLIIALWQNKDLHAKLLESEAVKEIPLGI